MSGHGKCPQGVRKPETRLADWSIPLAASVLTAGGAFGVGYTLERYRRHCDRQVLAATLLAEISAVLELMNELRTVEECSRLLASLELLQKTARPYSGITSEGLQFPVTVYEKCADKIGNLGTKAASEVVWFYNLLSGFRSSVRVATAESSLGVTARIATLEFVLVLLKRGLPRANALQGTLTGLVERPWFFWVRLSRGRRRRALSAIGSVP